MRENLPPLQRDGWVQEGQLCSGELGGGTRIEERRSQTEAGWGWWGEVWLQRWPGWESASHGCPARASGKATLGLGLK